MDKTIDIQYWKIAPKYYQIRITSIANFYHNITKINFLKTSLTLHQHLINTKSIPISCSLNHNGQLRLQLSACTPPHTFRHLRCNGGQWSFAPFYFACIAAHFAVDGLSSVPLFLAQGSSRWVAHSRYLNFPHQNRSRPHWIPQSVPFQAACHSHPVGPRHYLQRLLGRRRAVFSPFTVVVSSCLC